MGVLSLHLLFTGITQPWIFLVQVIQGSGVCHNTSLITAVLKTEEMAEFMGTLGDEAGREEAVIRRKIPEFIPQSRCRDHRGPGMWSCQPIYKPGGRSEDVVRYDQEQGSVHLVPPLVGVETGEDGCCVKLSPADHKPVIEERTVMYLNRDIINLGDDSRHRYLKTLWCSPIPEYMDIHSQYSEQ